MRNKGKVYVPDNGEMEWLRVRFKAIKEGGLLAFRWGIYKKKGNTLVCVKSLDSITKGLVSKRDIETEITKMEILANSIGVKFKDERGKK
jgi:hypothetical protein